MADEHVERIRAQFTRQAEAYSGMRVTRDEESMRRLVALVGTQGSDRVLDVACGPGFLTLAFAEKAARVLGVDATEALLHLGRGRAAQRGVANVEFAEGDATRLELPDASFDIVSCRAAFHHFPEPARVLAEMARVARPGGRLVVVDMLGSRDPEKAARRDEVERLCDPTHVRALPEAEFAALFRDAGLEVVQTVKVPLDQDVDEWLEHGGPPDADAARARQLLESSIDGDLFDLHTRREDGRLRFTYDGVVFVLRTPA
jgi:ubiquinone/menaquinone biosynthesis C-methylase UbiE